MASSRAADGVSRLGLPCRQRRRRAGHRTVGSARRRPAVFRRATESTLVPAQGDVPATGSFGTRDQASEGDAFRPGRVTSVAGAIAEAEDPRARRGADQPCRAGAARHGCQPGRPADRPRRGLGRRRAGYPGPARRCVADRAGVARPRSQFGESGPRSPSTWVAYGTTTAGMGTRDGDAHVAPATAVTRPRGCRPGRARSSATPAGRAVRSRARRSATGLGARRAGAGAADHAVVARPVAAGV